METRLGRPYARFMSETREETSHAATFRGRESVGRLGLPPGIRACLFDLDGVLTQTAQLHAEAWKEMFDAFLRRPCAARPARRSCPFDSVADYELYVDGRPRYDGVRAFLASRGSS